MRRQVVPLMAVAVMAATAAAPAAAAESATSPARAQCFVLSTAQLQDSTWPDTTSALSCETAHNVQVVAVLPIPAKYAKAGAQAMPAKAYARMTCLPQVQKVTGPRPSMTFTSMAWVTADARHAVCGGTPREYHFGFLNDVTVTGTYTRSQAKPICSDFFPMEAIWVWAACADADAVEFRHILLPGSGLETKPFPGKRWVLKQAKKIAGPSKGWSAPPSSRKAWNDGYRAVTVYKYRPGQRAT